MTQSLIAQEIEVRKGPDLIPFRSFIAGLLCLLLSLLPALCQSPAGGQAAGQIRALIPLATRNAKTAKVNDGLEWNDLLRTQQKGRVRAGLTDGSILSLGSNSELRVVQHDAASQQTSLEMNLGKVRSQVVKITQPNGKFEIKTANAVIGVIGTDFFLSYEANRTTVICYTGKVSVTPLGNAKVVQNSGQATQNQIQVSAGQMVVITTEIPPAGYEPETTPPAVQLASMQDTKVPDAPPPVRHVHLVRNVVLTVGLAVAGWVIAVTQLNTNAPPRQKGCQPPNCG